jgi:hypothetical protein
LKIEKLYMFFYDSSLLLDINSSVEAECSGEVGMDMTAEETAIVELVNAFRTEQGIPEVTIDPLLNQVAGRTQPGYGGKKNIGRWPARVSDPL